MRRLCNLSLKRKMAMAFCAVLGCVLLSVGVMLPSLNNGNAYADNLHGQITSDAESAGGGTSEPAVAKPQRAYTALSVELNGTETALPIIYADFTTVKGFKQNLIVKGTVGEEEFVLEPEEYTVAIDGIAYADSYTIKSELFPTLNSNDYVEVGSITVQCGASVSASVPAVTVVKRDALIQYTKLRVAPVTQTISDDNTPETLKKVLKVYGTYKKTEEDGTEHEVEEPILNRELYNVSFAGTSLTANTDNIITVTFVAECGGASGTVTIRPTFSTLQSVSVSVNPEFTQDSAGYYKKPDGYSGFVAGMTQEQVFKYGLVITAHYPNSCRVLELKFDDNGALQGGVNTQTGEAVNTDNRNFTAGSNILNFSVTGQKGTVKNASVTLPFEEQTVVAIEVSESWTQPDSLFSYTQLNVNMFDGYVVPTYNSGLKGTSSPLATSQYEVEGSLSPKGEDIGTTSPYSKDVTIRYKSDDGILTNIVAKVTFTDIKPELPSTMSNNIAGTFAQQTMHSQFDYSGLTVALYYQPDENSDPQEVVTQLKDFVGTPYLTTTFYAGTEIANDIVAEKGLTAQITRVVLSLEYAGVKTLNKTGNVGTTLIINRDSLSIPTLDRADLEYSNGCGVTFSGLNSEQSEFIGVYNAAGDRLDEGENPLASFDESTQKVSFTAGGTYHIRLQVKSEAQSEWQWATSSIPVYVSRNSDFILSYTVTVTKGTFEVSLDYGENGASWYYGNDSVKPVVKGRIAGMEYTLNRNAGALDDIENKTLAIEYKLYYYDYDGKTYDNMPSYDAIDETPPKDAGTYYVIVVTKETSAYMQSKTTRGAAKTVTILPREISVEGQTDAPDYKRGESYTVADFVKKENFPNTSNNDGLSYADTAGTVLDVTGEPAGGFKHAGTYNVSLAINAAHANNYTWAEGQTVTAGKVSVEFVINKLSLSFDMTSASFYYGENKELADFGFYAINKKLGNGGSEYVNVKNAPTAYYKADSNGKPSATEETRAFNEWDAGTYFAKFETELQPDAGTFGELDENGEPIDYNLPIAYAQITVNKAQIAVVAIDAPLNAVYSGSAHTITLRNWNSVLVNGDKTKTGGEFLSVAVSGVRFDGTTAIDASDIVIDLTAGTVQIKEAGSYTVTVTVNASYIKNYEWSVWQTDGKVELAEYQIAKKTLAQLVASGDLGKYNGTQHAVTVGGAGFDTSAMRISAIAGKTLDGKNTAITVTLPESGNIFNVTNAGTYTVTVELTDKNNYEWLADGEESNHTADLSLTYTLERQEIQFAWDQTNFIYDGSAHAPKPVATAGTVTETEVSAGTLTLSAKVYANEDCTSGEAESVTAAGTYYVKLTYGGTGAANFCAEPISGYVKPFTVTSAGLEAIEFKSPSEFGAAITVSGNTITVTYKAAEYLFGDFVKNWEANYMAGSDCKLIVQITYSGNTAAMRNVVSGGYKVLIKPDENYEWKDASEGNKKQEFEYTVIIDPLTIELEWRDDSFIYDGSAHKPTAEIKGLAAADVGKVEVNVGKIVETVDGAGVNAGRWTAEATGFIGDYIANYALPSAAADKQHTFTVKKKEIIAPTSVTDGGTFNGSTQTLNFEVSGSDWNTWLGALPEDGVSVTVSGKNVWLNNAAVSGASLAIESGVFSYTNAGTYTVTFTLADSNNYCWSGDGKAEDFAFVGNYEYEAAAITVQRMQLTAPALGEYRALQIDETGAERKPDNAFSGSVTVGTHTVAYNVEYGVVNDDGTYATAGGTFNVRRQYYAKLTVNADNEYNYEWIENVADQAGSALEPVNNKYGTIVYNETDGVAVYLHWAITKQLLALNVTMNGYTFGENGFGGTARELTGEFKAGDLTAENSTQLQIDGIESLANLDKTENYAITVLFKDSSGNVVTDLENGLPWAAGTYTVNVNITFRANGGKESDYQDRSFVVENFVVAKRAVAFAWSDTEVTYDGNGHIAAAIVTNAPDRSAAGDASVPELTVTLSDGGYAVDTFGKPINVKTDTHGNAIPYNVKVTAVSDADNYTFDGVNVSGELLIKKFTVFVTGTSVNNHVYGESVTATEKAWTFTGGFDQTTLPNTWSNEYVVVQILDLGNNEVTSSSTVGNNYRVVPKINNTDNYELSVTEGAFAIVKREITVTVKSGVELESVYYADLLTFDRNIYDVTLNSTAVAAGAPAVANGASDSLVFELHVVDASGNAAAKGSPAGNNYLVTLKDISSVSGYLGGNYTVNFTALPYEITNAEITAISVTGHSDTYDATAYNALSAKSAKTVDDSEVEWWVAEVDSADKTENLPETVVWKKYSEVELKKDAGEWHYFIKVTAANHNAAFYKEDGKFATVTVKIEKAVLRVSANLEIFFGEIAPESYNASGYLMNISGLIAGGMYTVTDFKGQDETAFKNNAEEFGLKGTFSYTAKKNGVQYVAGGEVGEYTFEFNFDALVSKNYTFGNGGGTLTVKELPLNVQIENKDSVYNAELKELTASVSTSAESVYDGATVGIFHKDDLSKIFTLSSDASMPFTDSVTGANATTNKVGKYAIVAANGAFAAGYAITYTGSWSGGEQSGKAGVYEITPASLALNGNITAYGETTPEKYDENEHAALVFGASEGFNEGDAAKTVDSSAYSVFYYVSKTQGETVNWGENGNGEGVLGTMPELSNAGIYYVHCRIEAQNHNAQEFEKTVQIDKANNEFKTPFAFEKANVVFGDIDAISASAWTYGKYDAAFNPDGYNNASGSHRVVKPELLFTRELPAINVTLEYFASAGATGETVDATTVTENFNDWFESVFNAGNFNAGFYKLTFTVDGTENYTAATSVRVFEVSKKSVTVKVDDATTVYGEEPVYSVVADGLVTNGTTAETLGQFNVTPEFTDDYAVGHGSGSVKEGGYTANISDASQSAYVSAMSNYSVTFETGTLTVTPRPVTIQIQNKSNHFDLLGEWNGASYTEETPEALTFSVTSGTIYVGDLKDGAQIEAGTEYVFDEVQKVFSLVTDAFKHEECEFSNRTNSAADYAISLVFASGYASDYALTWQDATFTIQKAALSMNITGPYKDAECTDKYETNDATTYDGIGKHFKATAYGNDSITFEPQYYAAADQNTPLAGAPVNAGSYVVVFRSNNPNYVSGAQSVPHSIYPRTLTVTGSVENAQPDKANSGSALAAAHYYNGAAYSVSYVFDNIVNNENVTYSVSYTDKEGKAVNSPIYAGEYTVHIALDAEWTNYSLNKTSEKFTVSKTVVVNPVASSAVKVTYGGSDNDFTVASYNGWTDFAGNKVLTQSVSLAEIVANNGGTSRLTYNTAVPDFGVGGSYMQVGEYMLTAKNAGLYTVKISLTDVANYEFADSSKTYFEFTFTVERGRLSVYANKNITVQYGTPFAADGARVKNVGVTYGIEGVSDADVAAKIATEKGNSDFIDSGLTFTASDYNNALGTADAVLDKTFGVKPSGIIAYNYNVIFNDGTVKVVEREIFVTAFGANNGVSEATRNYTGEADHESTLNNALKTLSTLNKFFGVDTSADESGKNYGSKAFGMSGDTIESLGLKFEFGNPTDAETYFMDALCENRNYKVSFVNSSGNTLDGENRPTYVIKKLALTVKAGSVIENEFAQRVSVVYGEDATKLYTVRYSGWLTGEGDEFGAGALKSGTVSGQIVYASKLNGTGKQYVAYDGHVGESYTVSASGLTFTNYDVTYVSCALAITPRYITATTFDREYTEDEIGGAVDYHGGEYGAEHDARIEFFGVGNSSDEFAPKFERSYSTAATDANSVGAAPTKAGDYTVTVSIKTNGIGADNRDYLFKSDADEYVTEGGINKFVSATARGDALTLKYGVTQKEIRNVRWSGNSEGNAPTYNQDEPEQTNTLAGYIKAIMDIASFTLGSDTSAPADVREDKVTVNADSVVISVYSSGTFTIGLKFNQNAARNYKWPEGVDNIYFEFRVTASRAEIIDFTIKSWTYNEYDASVNTPTAKLTDGIQGEITFTYAWVGKDSPITEFPEEGTIVENTSAFLTGLSFTGVVPVNAGYYVVRAYFAGNADFTNRSAYYLFRVSSAQITAPELDLNPSGYEYTGSVLSVGVLNYLPVCMRVSAGTQGLNVSYDGTLSAVDAKQYSVTFGLINPDGFDNYIWKTGTALDADKNVTLVWTIGKASNALTWNDNNVQTVYGTPYANKLTATAKFGGAITYYYANQKDFASVSAVTSWSETAPKNAGDYWIKVVSSSGDNFNSANNVTGTLKINKATLYATPSGNAEYGETYSQCTASFECVISGTFYYDNETVSSVLGNLNGIKFLQGSIPEQPVVKDGGYDFMLETEPGTDIVKGLSAANYVVMAQVGKFTVSPKTVRVWVHGASSFYGDEINESDVSYNLNINDSLAYSDDLASLGLTAKVNAKQGDNAGEYEITATASNKNYSVSFSADKYVIKPLEIRIAIKQDGATYTGERNILPNASVTNVYRADTGADITDSVTGANFSFVYSGVSNDGEWEHLGGNTSSESPYLAGTYTVTAESSLSGNYKLMGSTGIAFTIEKKEIDAQTEINVESKTYTGGKLTSNLTDNELYTVVEHIGDCVDAGTYKVKLQINNFHNVKWAGISVDTCELDFVILPAANGLKNGTALSIGGWTYGQYNAAVNLPTAETVFGEESSYVFEYSDSVNGKWTTSVPVNAGTHYVRLTVAGTKNYNGFVSEPVSFEIQKATLAAPQLTLNETNTSFTGSELQSVVSGFDSAVMGLEYDGNSKVLGSNVTVSALNAGEYTVKFILKDKTNYRWADGVQTDENGNAVRGWTVARMKVARPKANGKNYVVNGKTLVYILDGFDDAIMKITNNRYSYGGNFTAEITLADTANYEWEDGTTDVVYIKWHIVGGKTVFVVVVSVLSGLSAVAAGVVVAQVVLHKKKKRVQAEAENSEKTGGGDGGNSSSDGTPATQANAQGGTVA